MSNNTKVMSMNDDIEGLARALFEMNNPPDRISTFGHGISWDMTTSGVHARYRDMAAKLMAEVSPKSSVKAADLAEAKHAPDLLYCASILRARSNALWMDITERQHLRRQADLLEAQHAKGSTP